MASKETGNSNNNKTNNDKCVVVAVDGSEGSRLAFQYALRTSPSALPIRVFHIERPELVLGGDGVYRSFDGQQTTPKTKEFLKRLEDECKAQNRTCIFDSRKSMGTSSSISEGICDYGLNHQAESIVVGARGLSTVSRFLLGSVSGSLAQNCACSISIVKPPYNAYTFNSIAAERGE